MCNTFSYAFAAVWVVTSPVDGGSRVGCKRSRCQYQILFVGNVFAIIMIRIGTLVLSVNDIGAIIVTDITPSIEVDSIVHLIAAQ